MENKILAYLLRGKINFWKMVSKVGYMPDFVSALKKMEKIGLIKIENSYILLTEKGKKRAGSLKITYEQLPFPDIYKVEADKGLLEKYEKFRNRVFEKEKFDQLQITAKDVLRKIELMKRFDDLRGKRIVCLGDDDLVGIALALTKGPKEITVLDIDKEVIDYENNAFEKMGNKKAKAFVCDFLKPMPERFKGKYDVFISEPPDTVKGIALFFSRGIDCLKKKGGVAYLGISRNDLKADNFLKIEENILKMRGLITDIFSRFEGYNPSEIDFKWVLGLPKGVAGIAKEPWFFSDLFRVEILEGAVPLIKGKKGKKFRQEFIKTEIFLD